MTMLNIKLLIKILAAVGIASISGIVAVLKVLSLLNENVGIAKPTQKQLNEENLDNSPLFRHVPHLKTKVAWRELGNFPTPLHKGSVKVDKLGTMIFYVKREDLSSQLYGGNKVRTLQHQLATIEARAARNHNGAAASSVIAGGTGGSNQILATVVHAKSISNIPKITPVWMKDLPELDNTLNMLSTLTMNNLNKNQMKTWKDSGILRTYLGPIFSGSGVVLPPGGNSPAGVIGQIGGALELAEQIVNGDMPDPNIVYLPVGSCCTISGLIIGICLSRQLNLKAFCNTQICGIPIHHAAAFGHRNMNFLTAKWASIVPLTIRHTIIKTCNELIQLDSSNIFSKILNDALNLIDDQNQLRLITDSKIIGTYGGHSNESIIASQEYDQTGILIDEKTGKEQEKIWLCGHFTGKAFAAMRKDFIKRNGKNNLICLFWQTKSRVQPRGENDGEWSDFLKMPLGVQNWGDSGKSYSHLREGKVNTKDVENGKNGYVHLMTKIERRCKM
jgi:1-aminocyclopropane-1-carboxylate deaminase/D-cysteine desulfhydrase-like pyridoxal-dependent ACC family enzyme